MTYGLLTGTQQAFGYSSAAEYDSDPGSDPGEGSEGLEETEGEECVMPPPTQRSITHIEAFFAKFPNFRYNPSKSVMLQYYSLCDHHGWEKGDKQRQKALDDLKTAMVEQFNSVYGTDIDDIRSWRMLCQILRIYPTPRYLEDCREAVRKTHVNLVDLTMAGTYSETLPIFDTLEDLRKYTVNMKKFFPRSHVLDGSLLWYLLRHIFPTGNSPPPSPKKRRRESESDNDRGGCLRDADGFAIPAPKRRSAQAVVLPPVQSAITRLPISLDDTSTFMFKRRITGIANAHRSFGVLPALMPPPQPKSSTSQRQKVKQEPACPALGKITIKIPARRASVKAEPPPSQVPLPPPTPPSAVPRAQTPFRLGPVKNEPPSSQAPITSSTNLSHHGSLGGTPSRAPTPSMFDWPPTLLPAYERTPSQEEKPVLDAVSAPQNTSSSSKRVSFVKAEPPPSQLPSTTAVEEEDFDVDFDFDLEELFKIEALASPELPNSQTLMSSPAPNPPSSPAVSQGAFDFSPSSPLESKPFSSTFLQRETKKDLIALGTSAGRSNTAAVVKWEPLSTQLPIQLPVLSQKLDLEDLLLLNHDIDVDSN